MKKALIAVVVIVVLAIAWFLLSPLWRVEVRDDQSPLAAPVEESMTTATAPATDKEVAPTQPVEASAPSALPVPAQAKLLREGSFVARAHDVAGKALLIQDGAQQIIRFADFETVNGPDLRVYLSSNETIDDAVDLGIIKGTKGNINYQVPQGTDTAKYNHVLVWCRAFRVLFSFATLQ